MLKKINKNDLMRVQTFKVKIYNHDSSITHDYLAVGESRMERLMDLYHLMGNDGFWKFLKEDGRVVTWKKFLIDMSSKPGEKVKVKKRYPSGRVFPKWELKWKNDNVCYRGHDWKVEIPLNCEMWARGILCETNCANMEAGEIWDFEGKEEIEFEI